MIDRSGHAGAPAHPPSRKRALVFVASLLASALASASCAEVPRPHSDGAAASAQRIVSLVPSATELLLELGAARRIVGRTDYDTDPRIADAVSLGRTMSASVESVLTLTPDLVIESSYARWPASAEVLKQAHVAKLTTNLQTIDDVLSLIDTLGVRIDAPERAAQLRWTLKDAELELRRTLPAEQPTAVYLVWPDPPRTVSSTSYLAEVMALAGLRNAFDDVQAEWPEISLEAILQRDPDYIVVGTDVPGTARRLRELPAWTSLRAVRNDRIVEVPAALFHRPGPRVTDAAWWLRGALTRAGTPR
jgi:ABC-type Fe3+-hydroxamate transport system substrate-binding protein